MKERERERERERETLGDLCQVFQTHWTTTFHFFLSHWQWGTHIEQTSFIPSSVAKIGWIDILEMCRSSASFRMDEWQSSSITADTVLMLTYVHLWVSPPTCTISADSALPSANGWIMQRFILESTFQQSDLTLSVFLISRKNFYGTMFGGNIHFFVSWATHYLETHIFSHAHYPRSDIKNLVSEKIF